MEWNIAVRWDGGPQLPLLHLPRWGEQKRNIARIAKVALYKCPGKSSLNANHVLPVCPVYSVYPVFPFCLVCRVHHFHFCPVWPCSWYFSREVVATCFPKWNAWKVSMVVFVRKLEVVHNQVGGCLISYNLQLACLRKVGVGWPDTRIVDPSEWTQWCVFQSVIYVGRELLGQLKRKRKKNLPCVGRPHDGRRHLRGRTQHRFHFPLCQGWQSEQRLEIKSIGFVWFIR